MDGTQMSCIHMEIDLCLFPNAAAAPPGSTNAHENLSSFCNGVSRFDFQLTHFEKVATAGVRTISCRRKFVNVNNGRSNSTAFFRLKQRKQPLVSFLTGKNSAKTDRVRWNSSKIGWDQSFVQVRERLILNIAGP